MELARSPVSRNGDREAVIFFARILQAGHFGVDGEAIPGFTVKLLQETNIELQMHADSTASPPFPLTSALPS